MVFGVPFKIAGADECLGALRAGDLRSAIHGHTSRGRGGSHGKPGVVPGSKAHIGYSRRNIWCLIRKDNMIISMVCCGRMLPIDYESIVAMRAIGVA